MGFDTLLTKSMQEETGGMSAAGAEPHTAGPNTGLRRWMRGEPTVEEKKMMSMKREPEGEHYGGVNKGEKSNWENGDTNRIQP